MYARRAQKIERKNSLDPMAPSRCTVCPGPTQNLSCFGQGHAKHAPWTTFVHLRTCVNVYIPVQCQPALTDQASRVS